MVVEPQGLLPWVVIVSRSQWDSCRVSCLAIDEIAVARELTNERVHLTQRHRRPAFEVTAEEAVRWQA
jgi:hypothetical protein